MATADIVTIVPPGKRDAALVARCRTFTEREWEFTADNMARNGKVSEAELDAQHEELDPMVDQLCRSRARTLNGIRARVRTLLAIAPDLFGAGAAAPKPSHAPRPARRSQREHATLSMAVRAAISPRVRTCLHLPSALG